MESNVLMEDTKSVSEHFGSESREQSELGSLSTLFFYSPPSTFLFALTPLPYSYSFSSPSFLPPSLVLHWQESSQLLLVIGQQEQRIKDLDHWGKYVLFAVNQLKRGQNVKNLQHSLHASHVVAHTECDYIAIFIRQQALQLKPV